MHEGILKFFDTSNSGHWKDDEFYTSYEDIENQLKKYDLTNKKIYCPCDTEDSNFVKYMKNNNLNYKNTYDDYFNHEDIYKWCDIVITNPPFKNNTKWLRWFEKNYNKEFILIQPLFSIKNRYQIKHLADRDWFINGLCLYFERPDGERKEVATLWVSNCKEFNNEY